VSVGGCGQRGAECKQLLTLEHVVTKQGAHAALESMQWAEGPRGWLCSSCRAK
jgi:hypothetical protein